ncbi:HelD family protein [Sedimentibacter saalensis]|uniref:DNA helicase-2/ATP-dependent DNA helicase PcrA n=1 Tax=Sedimentibacter saalensis TaxID=130788 RepID=A0A562JL97_9FIRM|nr:UvrD-helicase domain-containing protein [Sedimentibacter saalensis]TWH83918.1 DNA helicase-2/ATP-dependent DNA helicase PcrA [Sedimentibacter saalensis]
MIEYNDKHLEEIQYLEEIINLLKYKLDIETSNLEEQKIDLIAARKEMWENTTHSSADFDKLSDLNQYLSALQAQTFTYTELAKRISKYEKMLDSPYFARIDFTEQGYDDTDKIYIGLFNLMDEETHDIKVYDWRAPISSVYYRNELGPVEYKAPAGIIKGTITLKRQYKITKGEMEYFFDSNINILDEMLMEALSQNMTSKMKTIVETIQKQQDLIIRDLENDLLVVQGVAGSGKSSVALHRIAFLMYQGLNYKLSANNIIVISPNPLFSKYISNVLPELGEDNINEFTFENIFFKLYESRLSVKTKSENFENIICAATEEERNFLRSYNEFKGSKTFKEILDRFVYYFEHKMIKFEDVYFNGEFLETKQLLKSFLLSGKLNMPTAKKLKIMENRIIEKLHERKLSRRSKIEKAVVKLNQHEFESKSFTRMLAAKETASFIKNLHNFTEFDCFELYKTLFENRKIFNAVSKGLILPENIEKIINYTNQSLQDRYNIPYADGMGLVYLKIKAEGCDLFRDIKQVVVDEAQDYYPLHYHILKNLYRDARFTVVGDVNQSVEKKSDVSIYDDIIEIFGFEKNNKVFLNKSYRSSYEISKFSSKLLEEGTYTEYFKRNEEEPEIIQCKTTDELDNKLIKDIENYKSQGLNTVAIICKNRKTAADLYFRIAGRTKVKLVDYLEEQSITGTIIVPVYLAKGLEFDAVMVYGTDNKTYNTDYDKKLLYIACTRALHRLSLYYTGKITRYLK